MAAEPDQQRCSRVRVDEHADVDHISTPHRQVSYGYVNEHFMMGHSELAAMRRNIVDCAVIEGYELAAIYIERVEASPAAWRALHEKLTNSSDPNVVIVPGLHHLAALGHPVEVQNILLESGTKVLVAGHEKTGGITTRAIQAPRR